jgi:uncharacterized oligopeptide transporter (OPT) family protein
MAMLGKKFELWELLLWTSCSAYYGLFFAVPLRRHSILAQKLQFPTGTATAETITAMHKAANAKAKKGAKASGGGMGEGGILEGHDQDQDDDDDDDDDDAAGSKATWLLRLSIISLVWKGVSYFIPVIYNVPVFGDSPLNDWKWNLNLSPAFIGAGMLMGPRVTLSMLAGSVTAFGCVGPAIYYSGAVESMWGYSGVAAGNSLPPSHLAPLFDAALNSLSYSYYSYSYSYSYSYYSYSYSHPVLLQATSPLSFTSFGVVWLP